MTGLFAEEAEIITPLTQQRSGGTEATRGFWDTYRKSFNSIASSFVEVVEQDDIVVLEWVSEGSASNGPFRYEGVTILECRKDKIACFRTYFSVRVRSGASQSRIDTSKDLTKAQAEAAERRKDGGYQ